MDDRYFQWIRQVLVDYGTHEVLEGPPIEGVVVLRFPDAGA
jgi:hypothetical protein